MPGGLGAGLTAGGSRTAALALLRLPSADWSSDRPGVFGPANGMSGPTGVAWTVASCCLDPASAPSRAWTRWFSRS